MSDNDKLTPKLRFPEFRTTWEAKRLDALSQLITDRAGNRPITPYTVTTGVGLVSQQERYGRTIAGSAFKNYYVLRTNDFAYNKSATKAYPQGYIARFRGEEGAVPNSIFTCFRVDAESINPAYVDYLFAGNLHGRWLNRFIEVSARAHGSLSIDDADLMSLPVPVPTGTSSLAEQQKIADCLSSLDDRIAAEGRKLQSLRAYKKGLMQQLFPRDGETVPRLRFPEFRGKEEWEEKRLGDLGTLVSGLTYSPLDVQEDGLLVLRSSNIQNGEIALDDCVYVRPDVKGANLSKPDDILICVRNGSKALIGKNAIIPKGMPVCTHGAFMTVFRASAPHFARVLLQSSAYQRQVAADLGATINSINGSQLLKYRFTVPQRAEQQRIAACLSTLDEQIAAQSRKIEGLKQHKKGLMQQLFPLAEEG
jgi:type I restriction enzyme S subunit